MTADSQSNRLGLILITIAVLVRVFVPGNLLDLFYDYDRFATGQPLLKIHPGTYLLALAALVCLPQRQRSGGEAFVLVSFVLGAAALICGAGGLVFGNTRSLGWIVDSELAAAALAFCLSRLTESDRQAMLPVVIGAMCLNCFISFGEWATHSRIIPYRFSNAEGERIFRPTALLNHPLINGLYTAGSIPFIMTLRTSTLMRYALLAIFATATITAETRFSTIVAVPITLLLLFLSSREKEDAFSVSRFLQLIMGGLFVPLVGLLALSLGIGERLSSGLIDQSSVSRLDIYSMLRYLNLEELLFGVGQQRALSILALRQTVLIESPLVEGIFLLGLPLTVLLFFAILFSVRHLLRGANFYTWLGAGAFLLIAASNNGLVTKTPELLFLIVLIAASRTRTRSVERARPAPASAGLPAGFAQAKARP